jgi:imidazolonepropionase-like amidohydrolase
MIRHTRRSTVARLALPALLLMMMLAAGASRAQQQPQIPDGAPVVESGEFRLHKFEQPIGVERYTVARAADSLVVRSTFEFTDRGTRVPLTAMLRAGQDLTPRSFEVKGNVSRFSKIDTSVEVGGATASVREGERTRQAQAPARFFTISGYAPVTMQMMLVRYMLAHRVEGALPVLPGGEISLERRGRDEVTIDGRKVALERYALGGLIWGRESIWLDSDRNLVALVTLDAEFDHFEALRPEYESALAFFVGRAAADNMAALAQLAERLSPARKGALAVTNATLVDGTNRAPVADAVVVVEGDRITAAGPRASVRIPKGAKILDAGGRYVMPGLWDMHAHFEQVEWGPVYLAAGVTTVRDVGNEFEFITSTRDAIRGGRGLGPRMLLAGVVDGKSPLALGVNIADTPEEGRAVVRRYHDAGFQQMKIYSSVKPDVLKAVAAEAHSLGMTVTGHVPEGMNAFQGVEAGMDQINHAQYLPPVMVKDYRPRRGAVPPAIDFSSPEAQSAIRFFKEHGTVFDPTLSIFEWFLHPANVPFAQIEPGAAKLPPELVGAINNTGVPPQAAPAARAAVEQFISIVGALHRAGIPIVAGTDQVVPGHSLHRELELYVKAGFTPLEAIQAATIVPARVMKMDKELGTIEPGKLADLIIVDGNPLEAVENTRRVRWVVSGGRVFEAAALWQSVGFKP